MKPILFIIETETHEDHVYAMDFDDATTTWAERGNHPADIIAIKEIHNPDKTDTIH
jgi:hypothetical protein